MAAWGGLCRQIEIVVGLAGILVRTQNPFMAMFA